MSTSARPLDKTVAVTMIRIGLCFLAIGIGALIAGVIRPSQSGLLDIGGVGCIVFGAVAVSVQTEAKNNGLPPRVKPVRTPKPETPAEPGQTKAVSRG